MGTTKAVPRTQHQQILAESTRLKRRVILTLNLPSGWRTVQGVFHSSPPPGGALLVVEIIPLPDAPAMSWPAPGASVGATFRMGHKKCMFYSTLESVTRANGRDQVTLRWPDQLQQLQRRAYERAAPPEGTVVAVRFWSEGDGASEKGGEERDVRHGQLEDISAGGMRIKAADPKDIVVGKTYRCALTPRPGKPALVLDAVLRHHEAIELGRASLGFQFVGLETTMEGIRALDQLAQVVQHFHRNRPR